MRIWDVNPGYLNRQSLLGEHRELHGIVSIINNGKKGYSHHPETIRWVGYGWALQLRHQLLAAEMALRGYTDRSPVLSDENRELWPEVFIDEPAEQFRILAGKYRAKEIGRIPIPESTQQLWGQHKYSVLARNENRYRQIGRKASGMKACAGFTELSRELTVLLRTPPSEGGTRNALQHMWGYVSDCCSGSNAQVESWPLSKLFRETQERALRCRAVYLVHSTALSELSLWTDLSTGEESAARQL